MSRAKYMADYRKRKASGKYVDKRFRDFPIDNCLNCNAELPRRVKIKQVRKFCNNDRCQHEYHRKLAVENGIAGVGSTKRFLAETRGYKCEKCGISEWQNEKLVLQLDHKNGDFNNNSPDNVRLLCPNCHSQTPTYGFRNRGKGRRTNKQEPKPFYLTKIDQLHQLDT